MTTTDTSTEPLIEASRIKFSGMSRDSLGDPPALDEKRTYTVEATCMAVTRQRMKDGETRLVALMEVDELWEGTGPKPEGESHPSLFDEGDTEDQGDDGWGEDTSHDTPVADLPLSPHITPFGGAA